MAARLPALRGADVKTESVEFLQLGKSAGLTVVIRGYPQGGDYGIPTVALCGCLDYLGMMTPSIAEEFAVKLLRAAAIARGAETKLQ